MIKKVVNDCIIIPVYLFRIVFETHKKHNFFEKKIEKKVLLKKLIELRPEGEAKNNIKYITSTPIIINKNGLYFKFGEIKKKNATHYNERKKDFFETQIEDTNYVHCIYNIQHQLLAIEKKSSLPSPKTYANRLSILINEIYKKDNIKRQFEPEEIAFLSSSVCRARQVYEPTQFIKLLKNAYKVNSFTVEMLLPNPNDFNDILKEPIDLYMEETGAEIAKVTVENKNDGLENKRLEKLSYEIAAYGANANAKIQENNNSKISTIKLNKKENAASVDLIMPQSMQSIDFFNNCGEFLQTITEKFKRIHGQKD